MSPFRTPTCLCLLILAACTPEPGTVDLGPSPDFLRGLPATTPEGLVNVVVEIPAGSSEKWEVDKATGHLEWERLADGQYRVVEFLPYPANYGMIPRTLLPKELGGDDDPLDVFLLGPARERGAVVPARIVGVIEAVDGGEQDDKLLAVDPDSWFAEVKTLDDLRMRFPGVVDILVKWLAHYKGGDRMIVQGVSDETVAARLLEDAVRAFPEAP